WLSPLAKALEGARVGQCVRFKVPAGDQELTILSVTRDE
ncbi:MAG: transcription elongation factor GreB, partial [Pedosphaera sp.]|nr:transcription elongation factor GreB [Pedosphaera sp.]